MIFIKQIHTIDFTVKAILLRVHIFSWTKEDVMHALKWMIILISDNIKWTSAEVKGPSATLDILWFYTSQV